MPHITAGGGVKLYYEEAGQGTPILFVHEFMGEYCSREAQLRYFSRRYRCVAYNARGYPPSDVPSIVEDCGFEHQRAGILAMLVGLKIDKLPTVVISGDEDEPCLGASLMLKRHMPSAGLVFMPQTGHACNLEEPELFNMVCEKFFHQVESGQYRMRDPRATPERML
jgi:pimeloyl-ACP methyl ester carboxylesterase